MEAKTETPFNNRKLQIVILGTRGVGKSTILSQYIFGADLQLDPQFKGTNKPDSGHYGEIEVSGRNEDLQTADACLFVFNPHNRLSFNSLTGLMDMARVNTKTNCKFFILTYCHLCTVPVVTAEETVAFADANKAENLTIIGRNKSEVESVFSYISNAVHWANLPKNRTDFERRTPTTSTSKPINIDFLMKLMSYRTLAIVSGVLLLAGIAALTVGSCGVGGAALALGLTIAGAVTTATTLPLFGFSLFKCYKQAKIEGMEKSHPLPQILP